MMHYTLKKGIWFVCLLKSSAEAEWAETHAWRGTSVMGMVQNTQHMDWSDKSPFQLQKKHNPTLQLQILEKISQKERVSGN